MKLLPAAVGTLFAAFFGWAITMIIGAAASGLTGDFLPGVRTYEGLIGAVSGAIAGGSLAYQGKHASAYGLGLFTRVALIGSGLPLMRLAIFENHWPSAMVFFSLGIGLFFIGCFLVLDIVLDYEGIARQMPGLASMFEQVHEMGLISLLTYLPIGLVMITLGLYASGGVALTCQRVEPQQRIDCRLEETRWLGLVKQVTALQDVQEATYEFGVLRLMTPTNTVPVVGGIINDVFQIQHAFQTFQDSAKSTLTTTLEPRWILFGISFVAAILVSQGISTDPLVAAPNTDRWRKTRRILQSFESLAFIFGLMFCLWGIGFFMVIVPTVQARIAEQENKLLLNSVEMLAALPDGAPVFIRGRISENNKVLLQDFVMYTVSRYIADEWQPYPIENMTPPFWIDLPGEGQVVEQRLWIGNNSYGLDTTYDFPREWYPDKEIAGKILRYRGYGTGDFVTIEGQVEYIAGEPAILAWLVSSETIETISEGSRDGLRFALIGGGVFTVIGLILLAIFGAGLVSKIRALS